MSDSLFQSSDSVRSGTALRFAQQATFDGPITLELGGELPSVTVAYETFGTLNSRRDNAVLVCHAISGDSHVTRHMPDDEPGWWEVLVGPDKWVDTNRYFVICQNVLGGCRGTTGPNSIDPRYGRPYGADFPSITVGDMVDVQRRVIDLLGIERLMAVIGGSLGGQQAMTWATRFPDRVGGCVAVASSARLSSQAIAFDVVGRNAILRDPLYQEGQYYGRDSGPIVGLAIARMLAHITYLSRDTMTEKFDPSRLQPKEVTTAFEKKFSVGSYLAYQGHKFVERFDANSYVTLSMAMDLFDLGGSPEALRDTLAMSRCRWLILSFTSDWLFPPEQSRDIVNALIAARRPVSYCNIEARGGHDSFLIEDKLDVYGSMIGGFLWNLQNESSHGSFPPTAQALEPSSPQAPTATELPADEPSAIVLGDRLDYQQILDLIPESASVLDLGCGSGVMLRHLRQRGHAALLGIELDERTILRCVERGLDVVQHDLETGLAPFTDGEFDVVVLSQTLQSVTETERIVDELIRVGRLAIVGFPNFAYHKLRTMLFEQGRSPKAEGPYGYDWWNTRNRRFPSIIDFEEFCAGKSIRIHRRVYLDTETHTVVNDEPNWKADVAIFVLSR